MEDHAKTEPMLMRIDLASTPVPSDVIQSLQQTYNVFWTGEGGFAFVIGAANPASGEKFAIKLPKSPAIGALQFTAEATFWLNLPPHPNIVRAIEVQEIAARPALFLEFIEGGRFNTLRGWLREGPLAREQALTFARAIAFAMEFAAGSGEVAHLDLKPENLMITAERTLKVTDFGLARRVQVVAGRFPTVSEGTWQYVAPEWFEGKALDSRADIFAWGLILLEMLVGRLPFDLDSKSGTLQAMRNYHSSGQLKKLCEDLYWKGLLGLEEMPLRELISRCLQRYPGERPQSFWAIRRELDKMLNIDAPPEPETALTSDDEFNRAVSLAKAGNVNDAKSRLNALLLREPQNVRLWLKIAAALDEIGDNQTAESLRRRFVR